MPMVAFHMWEPVRKNLIAEHQFYVEQARRRLLSQFENMESEVNEFAENLLKDTYFDPEAHDPYDVYEDVNDKSIALFQMLCDLQERTRLSVIAGMYHEWDKNLRDWVTREMRHWHLGPRAMQAIWNADMPKLVAFLRSFDWDVTALPCYARLDAMRLVVNVFKHGEGPSLEQLKSHYPNFFPASGAMTGGLPTHLIDHTQMRVEDQHVDEFSEAITAFWESVPERIYAEDEVEAPEWFDKALRRDRANP